MMATCGRVYASWRSTSGGSGYRRLHIVLRRDGIASNRKKTQRLYREKGLTLR